MSPVAVTVFVGTIVHSRSLTELEILSPGVLGVTACGKVAFLESLSSDSDRDASITKILQAHGSEKAHVRKLSPHTLLLPGLIDTHVHAPQYAFTGTGYTLPLLNWLEKYTFPQEKRFASTTHAETLYPKAVSRSLRCGTTTAAWYGTLHVPATKILAQTCARLGQRAFVGKVCMDRNGGDGYVEENAADSLQTTQEFLDSFEKIESDRVKPIITPRFAISCTPELLRGLGDMAEKNSLPIQTHCSENAAECAFVQELFPESKNYVDVYAQHNLLNPRTILAHCVHLSDAERKALRKSGAGVSHCPVSNFGLDSGACDVRALLDEQCKVGLGTDVAGGWSMSIVEAMRSAIIASRVVGFGKREVAKIQDGHTIAHKTLSLAEVFYLATLGGAELLNIQHSTGNFMRGKEFDALVVDLDASTIGQGGKEELGTRTVEVFDHDDAAAMLEKFVFVSDDRNIREVYVAGSKVI
ncbi:guanine deaminase [Powellomyces hirtus]|nr:guanine deaminase [Powellomyces hirtus]